MNPQAPRAVVMVRPHAFRSNPETQGDNGFQSAAAVDAAEALFEFDSAVAQLRAAGIRVHVFEDHGERDTPDSVFPNNWFSTHAGGHVALFPMYSANRRRERRGDVIEMLKTDYRVQDVIDYSGLEQDGLSLEGTGAMVLDHVHRLAYVARSNRADPVLLERFCTHFNYEPMVFDAFDTAGVPVYHTNVIMAIGTEYALICLDMIRDERRRKQVAARLAETRQVIPLTPEQIGAFAGNALELTGHRRRLALSARAYAALRQDQIDLIGQSAEPLPLAIPTLETAGGSIRCMMAGIHLTPRERNAA